MRLNKSKRYIKKTHEGGKAFPHLTHEQGLRRSIMSCFLWEKEFYEDGESIADRIATHANNIAPVRLAEIALETRNKAHLRHAPLLLLEILTRTGSGTRLVGDTIAQVIQRPDEIGEFLAICKKRGMTTLSKQMKIGLGRALKKFDGYQLSKYNRDSEFKLRDALFLTHAKPDSKAQAELFEKLAQDTLPVPDTWEVGLSTGQDKKETFERLLRENKLGYMALLRNLRNMAHADVDENLIRNAILARRGAHRVLPFRFIAAARACPQFEPALDMALVETIYKMPPLEGKTVVLVDVSGSMEWRLSHKSDMTRMDAAAGLASVINADLDVFSFSQTLQRVPPRLGMAGVDAIRNSQRHLGTYLRRAIEHINQRIDYDRIIVITDEQSHDGICDPVADKAYLINVASNINGVGYGRWTHIDGFSENVIKFIYEFERAETA